MCKGAIYFLSSKYLCNVQATLNDLIRNLKPDEDYANVEPGLEPILFSSWQISFTFITSCPHHSMKGKRRTQV